MKSKTTFPRRTKLTQWIQEHKQIMLKTPPSHLRLTPTQLGLKLNPTVLLKIRLHRRRQAPPRLTSICWKLWSEQHPKNLKVLEDFGGLLLIAMTRKLVRALLLCFYSSIPMLTLNCDPGYQSLKTNLSSVASLWSKTTWLKLNNAILLFKLHLT